MGHGGHAPLDGAAAGVPDERDDEAGSPSRRSPQVERATGMVMYYYGIDADRASVVLDRWSSVRGMGVHDLCTLLLARAVSSPRPELPDGLQALLDGDLG